MPRRDDYDDYDDDDYDRPRRRRENRYDDRYDNRDDDDDRPAVRRDNREYDDGDDDYDDYTDEPRPRKKKPSRARARERVLLPAIFLMIVGGIEFAAAAFNTVMLVTGVDDGNPFAANDPNMKNDPAFQAGQVIGAIFSLTWGPIVFFGGLQMKSLRNRGFVLLSSIWALIPCNACCVLGLPFGIWALVVVNDQSIKRAFYS